MNDQELLEAIQRTRLEITLLTRRLETLEADAIARMKEKAIPGYVLADRYGHRQWSADEPVIKFMLGGLDIMTLKTPSQIEKMGVDSSVLKPLTNRPFLGHYIARTK
jgi:hypothetical protein